MKELKPRPDTLDAFTALQRNDIEILVLSNGSTALTEHLLTKAELRRLVKRVVSVDDVNLSKPRAEVYLHAAKVAGVRPAELALVAAHAWDVNGAASAGLKTAYVSADRPFSGAMRSPDVSGETLSEAVAALLER